MEEKSKMEALAQRQGAWWVGGWRLENLEMCQIFFGKKHEENYDLYNESTYIMGLNIS